MHFEKNSRRFEEEIIDFLVFQGDSRRKIKIEEIRGVSRSCGNPGKILLSRKQRSKEYEPIFIFTAILQPNVIAQSDFSLAARKTNFQANLGDRSLKVISLSRDQDQVPNAQGPLLIKVKTCQQLHI